MAVDLQQPFDIAIVMATVVRDTFGQALHSVYAQSGAGRIQVLIGVDRWQGDRQTVAQLARQSPSHIAVTTLDLGYSTSQRNGGIYPSHYGGALKTILSYAANSRYVAYLDDDNWLAPEHVETMLRAVAGKAWAYSLRHFVDAESGDLLCPDTWESMGPHRGVYATAQGGFVDTNCYVIDALACSDVFPEWAITRFAGGTGGDRQVLAKLRSRPWGTNGAHTVLLPDATCRPASVSVVAIQVRGCRSRRPHAAGRPTGRRGLEAVRRTRSQAGGDEHHHRPGFPIMSAAEPPQGANSSPAGAAQRRSRKRGGIIQAPQSRLKARIPPPRGAAQRRSRERGGIIQTPQGRLKARIRPRGGQRSGEAASVGGSYKRARARDPLAVLGGRNRRAARVGVRDRQS